MAERDDAIRIANRILDRPGEDPDSDEAILARQFLRVLYPANPPHLVPSSTAPAKGVIGRAAGEGCPKCGGLRQAPMGCVIRLPESECGMTQAVDVIEAGEFTGHAGFVKADAPRGNRIILDDPHADITEED